MSTFLAQLQLDFNPAHHPIPWIVSILNVLSVLHTRRGLTIGWWYLAAAQLTFIAYTVTTPGASGFLLQNLLMLTVALDSAHMWTVRDPLAPRTASARRAVTFIPTR